MQRVPHSPTHRRGNMLCNNFSGRSQTVSRSLEYLPDPQHFHPNSVGEHNSFPNPTSMTPVPASVMNFQMSHFMDPVNTGMCPTQPSMDTLHQPQIPQFVDPRFVANSRLAANTVQFMDTPQLFDTPANFGQIFNDPQVAPQPPTPPDPRFVANSRLAANIVQFMDTSQLFDTPADSGKIFHDPQVAPQPPTPPAAPDAIILPNLGYQYHRCLWLGGPRCDGFAPGKNKEMAEHLRIYHLFIGHERDLVPCEWYNCGQSMQRMNVARHIVSRHLRAAATCRFCGRRFCRPDVVTRHERGCNVIPSV